MSNIGTEDVVYKNDTYTVAVERRDDHEGGDVYVIINNQTGVREMKTLVLPEALHTAVHWDIDVVREQHLWPYKKLEEQETSLEDVVLPTLQ